MDVLSDEDDGGPDGGHHLIDALDDNLTAVSGVADTQPTANLGIDAATVVSIVSSCIILISGAKCGANVAHISQSSIGERAHSLQIEAEPQTATTAINESVISPYATTSLLHFNTDSHPYSYPHSRHSRYLSSKGDIIIEDRPECYGELAKRNECLQQQLQSHSITSCSYGSSDVTELIRAFNSKSEANNFNNGNDHENDGDIDDNDDLSEMSSIDPGIRKFSAEAAKPNSIRQGVVVLMKSPSLSTSESDSSSSSGDSTPINVIDDIPRGDGAISRRRSRQPSWSSANTMKSKSFLSSQRLISESVEMKEKKLWGLSSDDEVGDNVEEDCNKGEQRYQNVIIGKEMF